MKTLYVLVFLICCARTSYSQADYMDYHARINDAEALFFIKDNPKAAFAIYDRLLNQYTFVFVKDFLIAAQMACRAGDSRRLHSYLAACFRNGLRIEQLALSPLFVKRHINERDSQLRSLYEPCRKQYLAGLDRDYLGRIYQIYAEDQVEKNLPADQYKERLRAHMEELIGYIAAKGFPSDRLAGIDDSTIQVKGRNLLQWYRNFCRASAVAPGEHNGHTDDNALASCTILYFLVHHPCSYQKLLAYIPGELKKGNMHPRDAGLLYDNAMRMKFLAGGRLLACNEPGPYYYRLNAFCSYPENWRDHIRQIDSLRRTLNICPVSEDSVKRAGMAAYGFYGKSGFWSCR